MEQPKRPLKEKQTIELDKELYQKICCLACIDGRPAIDLIEDVIKKEIGRVKNRHFQG